MSLKEAKLTPLSKVGFFKSLAHSIRTKREEASVHRVTSHYIHLQDIALSLLTLADFQNIVIPDSAKIRGLPVLGLK